MARGSGPPAAGPASLFVFAGLLAAVTGHGAPQSSTAFVALGGGWVVLMCLSRVVLGVSVARGHRSPSSTT